MFAVNNNIFDRLDGMSDEDKEELIKSQRRDGKIGMVQHPTPMSFTFEPDEYKKCKQKLADANVGCSYDYDNQLLLFRSMSQGKITFLGEAKSEALNKITPIVLAESTRILVERDFQFKNQNQSNRDFLKDSDEEILVVREFQKQRQHERASAEEQQKRKVSKPFDASDFSTWAALSQSDAERSKENQLDKISESRKKIKKIDAQLSTLDEELKPIVAEKTTLEEHLKEDISATEFKEIRDSIDYCDNRLARFNEEIGTQSIENEGLLLDIAKAEDKLKILNLCLDRYALSVERVNFEKRRLRTLERIQKTLRERDSLETLRDNLNSQWLELTGDDSPLCAELCLKADAEIYFV